MQEKFISIDELIKRAKFFGVDFGKGNPRNRLRYYTKIGLLPHAVRKSFDGKKPVGAYPETVLKTLIEIDKKLKKGKKIQQIKRELEKEKLKKERREEFKKEIEKTEFQKIFPESKETFKKENFLKRFFERKLSFEIKAFKKILISISVFIIILFLSIFLKNNLLKMKPQKILTNFLAQISNLTKIAQAPKEAGAQVLPPPSIEPFLTINAETLVKPSLQAEKFLSSPIFIFQKGERKGILETEELTADRTFTLPDESGIVCLSTGNCVAIIGEVLTAGGTENRISKFIGANRIGDSSIVDKFAGVSITIDEAGNVGIGTESPRARLDVLGDSIFTGRLFVEGEVEATGDVCTQLEGGKCLSQLITAVFGGGGGIGGSGTPGYFPIFTASTRLGNSILRQSGNTLYLTGDLNISGLLSTNSFQLTTTSVPVGYVLTAISTSGLAAWRPVPTGTSTLPAGSFGYTLRHNGTQWIADDFLFNTGNFIGIGTTSTSTLATLAVAGPGYFENSLTINSPTLSQLILQLGSDQFLLEIDSNFARISSPKDLIINSLTGHILATTSVISASSFVAYDATVRAPGEYVFREAIPIFKYPLPAETATTSFVEVSRVISPSEIISPISQLQNTQREYAFLINMADDIPQTSSSTWQIFDVTASTTFATFTIAGHGMSSLDEGKPVLTNFMSLPSNDWRLKVSVPSASYKIRIFNILLLVFDKLL